MFGRQRQEKGGVLPGRAGADGGAEAGRATPRLALTARGAAVVAVVTVLVVAATALTVDEATAPSRSSSRSSTRPSLPISRVRWKPSSWTVSSIEAAPVGATWPSTTSTSTAPTATTTTTFSAPPVQAPAGGTGAFGVFNAVHCTSVTTCIAVGSDTGGQGAIAVTGDGGAAWSASVPLTTAPPLYSLACGDAQHCVAGGRGAVLVTSDGGASWTDDALPPQWSTTDLRGVWCSPHSTCLAAGSMPETAGGDVPELLASSDGGSTWQATSLPPGVAGIGSVTCATASRCIAVGSAVLVSSDGGQTWALGTVAGGVAALTSVTCLSATSCIAVGPNATGVLDPSAPANAIVTTDGGETWSQGSFPAGTAATYELTCGDANDCIAAGPGDVTGSAATFVQSTNGGQSWSVDPAPGGMTAVNGVACVDGFACVVVGLGGQQSVVGGSINGSSWSLSEVPGEQQ